MALQDLEPSDHPKGKLMRFFHLLLGGKTQSENCQISQSLIQKTSFQVCLKMILIKE